MLHWCRDHRPEKPHRRNHKNRMTLPQRAHHRHRLELTGRVKISGFQASFHK
ncbi:hypothetical protein GQ44DRAFT_217550 [Phaeosphaeriaceae sp. PMI808]|nr:hypothetical protein GQ44DRAFT_217550 [Phaeosphaeriaceae sp. PMI808]